MTVRAAPFLSWITSAFFAVALLLAPANAAEMLECDFSAEVSAALDSHGTNHGHTITLDDKLDPPPHAADHCASHGCISALTFEAAKSLAPCHLVARYEISADDKVLPKTPEGIDRPPRPKM